MRLQTPAPSPVVPAVSAADVVRSRERGVQVRQSGRWMEDGGRHGLLFGGSQSMCCFVACPLGLPHTSSMLLPHFPRRLRQCVRQSVPPTAAGMTAWEFDGLPALAGLLREWLAGGIKNAGERGEARGAGRGVWRLPARLQLPLQRCSCHAACPAWFPPHVGSHPWSPSLLQMCRAAWRIREACWRRWRIAWRLLRSSRQARSGAPRRRSRRGQQGGARRRRHGPPRGSWASPRQAGRRRRAGWAWRLSQRPTPQSLQM